MPRPWDAPIARLRRRTWTAAAIGELGRWLLPATPVALLFLLGTRVSPWLRYLAVEIVLAAAAVILGAALLSMLRQRHSRLYLAKWIDLENALEDRLSSAVEWEALPSPDEFQRQCIERLSLDLAAQKSGLKLPRTRPTNLKTTGAALVVLAAVALVTLRQPAPELEPDAREPAKINPEVASAAAQSAQALQKDVTHLEDLQLTQLATDLSAAVQSLSAGTMDRQRSLAELEQLRQKAGALAARGQGALGEARRGGLVGNLARALASGDPQSVQRSLDEISAGMASGSLGEDEVDHLRSLLSALSSSAQAKSPDSAKLLANVAQQLSSGDGAHAAQQLSSLKGVLPAIAGQIAAAAAADRAAAMAGALERSLQPNSVAGEVVAELRKPAASRASGGSLLGQTATSGQNGAGERSAGNPTRTPEAVPPAEKGPDVQLTGVWNGKVIRSLFDSSGGAADEQARRLLVEHERAAEERFDRDEIPAEYADAVRTYFAGLHQRGGPWTPTRK